MKTKRRVLLIIIALVVVIVAVVFVVRHRQAQSKSPVVRTAKVERGSVTTTVTANGTLQAPRTVEVKSNVGGEVVLLTVDEGDEVQVGQLIARIDPKDSLSNLQQSQADLTGAQSRVQQAKQDQDMQRLQTSAAVRSAEQAVEAARQRLGQAEKQAQIQPQLTDAAIKQAESGRASAQASLEQTKSALIPQALAAAQSAFDQAKAGYDQADKNLTRQRALLAQGFVPQSDVDSAEQQYASAKAQLETARNKLETIKAQTDQDLRTGEAKVEQANASLASAQANRVQDELKQADVAAARASLNQAQASLESTQAGAYQERMKLEAIVQAQASLQRSKASVENAQNQVDYTTIVAPSAGIVVKKYVEQGGIVTAGRTSSVGSGAGVAIVDIADVSLMQVLANVDQTDISQIQVGQAVDISLDAYHGERFSGTVTKIAPQATVNQNVTTVPVTVDVTGTDTRLKPGMDATCDIITASKDDVLLVPNEAVKENGNGNTVTVLENGQQVSRKVEVGLAGNDTTEIVSGLNEGEKVVTSVIESSKASGTSASSQSSSGQSSRGGGHKMPGPPPIF